MTSSSIQHLHSRMALQQQVMGPVPRLRGQQQTLRTQELGPQARSIPPRHRRTWRRCASFNTSDAPPSYLRQLTTHRPLAILGAHPTTTSHNKHALPPDLPLPMTILCRLAILRVHSSADLRRRHTSTVGILRSNSVKSSLKSNLCGGSLTNNNCRTCTRPTVYGVQ